MSKFADVNVHSQSVATTTPVDNRRSPVAYPVVAAWPDDIDIEDVFIK
jgi:hypothetical protein